jgi:hypothetical protein
LSSALATSTSLDAAIVAATWSPTIASPDAAPWRRAPWLSTSSAALTRPAWISEMMTNKHIFIIVAAEKRVARQRALDVPDKDVMVAVAGFASVVSQAAPLCTTRATKSEVCERQGKFCKVMQVMAKWQQTGGKAATKWLPYATLRCFQHLTHKSSTDVCV